jgi:Ca2+-dependent lipid-binding protein
MENMGLTHLDIGPKITTMNFQDYMSQMLMMKTQCMIKVYIISAFDLASRDVGSHSDPYVVLKLGNTVVNERDNYQLDEPNPVIGKVFNFETTFPGALPLKLQFFDYDDLFGDDLIGESIIDLEDRFFSADWQSLKHKPIEYRQIYHKSTSVAQGVCKMWIEIHPSDKPAEEITEWNI